MNPHDNPSPEDLDLARRVGEALEHPDDLDAELETLGLTGARAILVEDEQRLAPDDAATSRMWSRVEGRTRREQRGPARIYRMPVGVRWAVAAMLLIAATIVFVILRTPSGEQLIARAANEIEVVTMADGSIIQLRPHSSLYSRPSEAATVVVRLDGEALFDVTADVNRTFRVATAQGAVTVLGTRFNVSTWGERTEIYLHRGRIAVEVDDEREVLEPGMAALIENDDITTTPSVDEAVYLDWTRDELAFVERRAVIVAAELAHHFDIDIRVEQPLADETVTGSLQLQSAEETLRDLAAVLGAELQGSAGSGYILGRR